MKIPSLILALVVAILAISLLSCEKSDFGKAQKTNTVEAYQEFLKKHPDGKLVPDAKAAIAKLDWEAAQKADTVKAYQGFLAKHSDSEFAAQAKQKITAIEEQEMASKEKKAISNLATIRAALESYKAESELKQAKARVKKNLYIECKPSPPNGGTDAEPEEWSDAGGFTQIGFQPSDPVLYQYAVSVGDSGTKYTATAKGDLDGDGIQVTFTVTNDNPDPVKSPQDEH